MSLARRVYCSIVLMVVFLSTAGVTRAQEGGNAAEHSFTEIFKWIHFVILAGIAYWLFAKVLPPWLEPRSRMPSLSVPSVKLPVAL